MTLFSGLGTDVHFSAACPAHPGSLAMTSITVVAVICNADEPCCVNTVLEPESFFYNVPSEYKLGLVFFDVLVQTPNS